MKRWLRIFAVLAVVGVVMHDPSQGQTPPPKAPVDVGPGEGGATLRLPGSDPVAPSPNPGGSSSALPYYLKDSVKSSASAYPTLPTAGTKVALPPSNSVDMNKDIEVKVEVGQWMIFVMAYTGPKAPEMARNMVRVLRGHYKLNAYVFNYGAEEKRKEFERVQKIRQEQVDALAKAGLKADVPIRVAAIRIDEQTGVLVGGFKTFDEAALALKNIRKLDPKGLLDHLVDKDGKLEGLDSKFVVIYEADKGTKSQKEVGGEHVLVNPFLKAFPARNPALPKDQPVSTTEEDLKFLRHVNREEPLTLFNCKKPYTLVIKQFNMQHKMLGNSKADAEKASGFLDRLNKGLLFKEPDWQDNAAHNAHNLAEGLRKAGLSETYVLHSKKCSFVTVGGFDQVGDAQMTAMQNWLETRFKMEAFSRLDMFPRPIPMQVPR